MTNPKQNIIWDVGRVMVDWNPDIAFEQMGLSGEKLAWFMQNVATMDGFIHPVDAGESCASAARRVAEEFRKMHPDKIADYSDCEQLLLRYPDNFAIALHREMPGSRFMRDHLRAQGHPTYALTNFAEELWEKALPKYPWLEQGWDGLVMSGREKVRKPDPAIFDLILSRHGINPQNAIFIDDSLPNIETARSKGIIAIHYAYGTPAPEQKLLADLRNLGLSLPDLPTLNSTPSC